MIYILLHKSVQSNKFFMTPILNLNLKGEIFSWDQR